jgi:rRNA-processing protein FCF1
MVNARLLSTCEVAIKTRSQQVADSAKFYRNIYMCVMISRYSLGQRLTIQVILDSNFLFVPLQFKIDIFEGITNLLNQRFEPVILSPIYRELQKMAEKSSPKLRKQASLALKLAEKCSIVDVEKREEETNDDVIVRVAAQWDRCPVATNDRELRKKLRNINVPVIYLRQKSRFELEGSL